VVSASSFSIVVRGFASPLAEHGKINRAGGRGIPRLDAGLECRLICRLFCIHCRPSHSDLGASMLRAYGRIVLLLAIVTLPLQGLASVIGPCCANLDGSGMPQGNPIAHDHHHPAPGADLTQTVCECADCLSCSLSVLREPTVGRVTADTKELPVAYRSAIADYIPGPPLRPPSL